MKTFATFSSLGYMGELGNQMFQVASVIGYSRKWGKDAIFPPWICKISGRDYRNIFKNSVDQTLTRELFSSIKFRFDYEGLTYQDLSNTEGNVDFRGYFQSEKYFDHCKDEIREIFQPNESITEYIERKYSDLFSEENKAVLHVRTAKRNSNDYDVHSSATYDFIETAQSYFGDELFVVFADNMEIAKTMLPKGKRYFFVENEENYVDMFLMTYFEKYIVSPSTFGWWGAWLSQNKDPKVTIMKDWFAIGKAKEYLNKDNDQVPERWIKI
jgi:hypothetical protein